MAGLNIIGSYSGIDQATIDKLMEAEKLPLVQLSNKKTDITAKQNAWKDVNTRLNSLFEKLKVLQSSETFNSMTAKLSNDEIISATASKDAVAGKYKINVSQLATSTSYISEKISLENGDITKALGITTGKFTITNADGDSRDINIEASDSLKAIVEKINEAAKDIKGEDGETIKGTGINATIIDGRLILTDSKTGERNIDLNGYGNGTLASLGLDEAARDENIGVNSKLNINGIDIETNSNTITDAVLGLTINLNKEGDSTVTVAADTEKLTKAIQDFVDQYNSTMGFIEKQLAAGTVAEGTDGSYTTEGRGALAGDSSLRSLHDSLRRMVTETLGGNEGTTINDISILGISTKDKSGVLSFDSSKFLEEFSKDSQNVMNFFSNKVDDEDVGFIAKLNTKIDSYISSKDGLIKSKNESLDRTLKDLNKQIDRFNDRMVRKEEYYTKKFAALDIAMMQAESQMAWLEGQISAMNAQTAANKK
jgi:flagellar hook-associated protein 2